MFLREITERIEGYRQVHFYRSEPSQRLFGRVSAVLIVGIHIYALAVFGSTFWIDSSVYVALSEALKSPQGMAEFYHEGGRWMFSHLQPGVSILWLCLSIFKETWRWPVLAISQHAIAALALWFTFSTINRYWPTWLHLVPLTILALLPTYQSFHNALLTESLTSSIFLIAFSACLRIAYEPSIRKRDIFTALLAIFIITQFRSYWGVTIALMLCCALQRRKLILSVWMPLLLLVAVGAATAFPIYRFIQTGQFFLPQGGMNSFITGLQVNPNPSNKVRETFDGIEFPPSLPASAILSNGLNLRLALDIGHFWRNVGLSDGAINDRAERLGKALTNDGPEIQIRRAIYGIASLGSTMVYSLGDSHREIFRGMTMAAMMDHQNYYYRWFGWISGEDYQRYLDSFFGPTSDLPPFSFDSIAAAQIKRAWQPYLSSIPSSFLRDPVSLGSLPPDVWLASGFVAFLILIVRLPFVAMLFFLAVAVAFGAAFSFPVGDTRYANALIPFYLVAISIAVGVLIRRQEQQVIDTAA
ncbi:hypothetical protein GR247_20530 [Rhizobium leguminosarum]|uniref:Glycosyltransferase RgtA/B/C/D-like domain-containing protein n=1 Tax=Rhizobium ruizarguesonis TaxID=2081791 RepID=A0AB38I161_9HYPH|nr:hypothetical protein [Rhizobium ruizarguesonis]NEJ22539.1 hypothetical protein [Rhizobium leguminosarum]TBC13952.1 hypothetical protein ELH40_02940 [Rhizobium ruizarguesonis]